MFFGLFNRKAKPEAVKITAPLIPKRAPHTHLYVEPTRRKYVPPQTVGYMAPTRSRVENDGVDDSPSFLETVVATEVLSTVFDSPSYDSPSIDSPSPDFTAGGDSGGAGASGDW